ncbi:DUF1294 domain-containing protein [Methylophilus sp. QUAN]|uniref:DUF1294 domain-containing protein n=1 Tax=Methylophilus sp. QUAN TaxID=2781020 RepID=UPI00188F67A2|nr:DUF1294 domain-containing protein [Methylophilus sp. QUAN]MBF4991022.1 DUF1294 domain-containing protein [Methylophilus sp. QUAN]
MTIKLFGDLIMYFGTMGGLTFGMFYVDKRAAVNNLSRIPETWLMAACVAFGWIGAIMAMKFLRHKNRKKTFIAKLVFAILANLVVIYMMLKASNA